MGVLRRTRYSTSILSLLSRHRHKPFDRPYKAVSGLGRCALHPLLTYSPSTFPHSLSSTACRQSISQSAAECPGISSTARSPTRLDQSHQQKRKASSNTETSLVSPHPNQSAHYTLNMAPYLAAGGLGLSADVLASRPLSTQLVLQSALPYTHPRNANAQFYRAQHKSLSPSKSLSTAQRDFAPTTTRSHQTTLPAPLCTDNTLNIPFYLGERPRSIQSCDMELSSMLSAGHQEADGADDSRKQNHQYATRHGPSSQESQYTARPYTNNMQRPAKVHSGAVTAAAYPRHSPTKKDQKHVLFQLIGHHDARIQARLPMRVMISPHDNTDSIIASVRNFYGLYDYGVSFETSDGISIIAAWDNFDSDMTVYVRAVPLPPQSEHARESVSPKKAVLGAPFEMRPPVHSPSRSAVRSAGIRSVSPQSDTGRRSASAAPGHRSRTQRIKSKDNSVMGDHDGYSSDNNDNGSVASSRRSKVEEIKAEITVDNIVEGGRRKRAFESSVRRLSQLSPRRTLTSSRNCHYSYLLRYR